MILGGRGTDPRSTGADGATGARLWRPRQDGPVHADQDARSPTGSLGPGWGSRAAATVLGLVLAAVLGLAFPAWSGREVKVSIYYQWSGSHGRLVGERPFFLIRDLDELKKFWRKVPFEESLPSVDFQRCMLFVACPGPTLFDYQPMKMVGFLRQDLRFTILLDVDRRRTGGYWRNPWLVALLPRVEKGDIDVMRLGDKRKGEPTRVPLFTIWDMRRIRDLPLVKGRPYQEPSHIPPLATYGLDLTKKKDEFVITVKVPKVVVTNVHKPATQPGFRPPQPNPPPGKQGPGGQTPPTSPSKTVPATTPGDAASGTASTGGTQTGTNSSPSTGTASAADPFGDAFNLDF